MKGVKFNYDTNTFEVDAPMTEVDELKQWIKLLIKVEKDKYKIYDDNFGMSFDDIIGYRLPRSVQVSEIIRRLKRTIIQGAFHVVDVKDFTFDRGKFTFTVVTDLGEEVVLHV